MRHVDPFRYHNANMPVNARSAVPAAVWLFGVVYADRQHVRAGEVQCRCQVESERRVAVRMRPQLAPIQIYSRIAIHAVKLDAHAFTFPTDGSMKGLAIPPNSCWKVPFASAGRIPFFRRAFNAPVVRQINCAPRGIDKRRRLCSTRISEKELPSGIGCELLPRRTGVSSGQGS